jgi:CubicO group peptidase (beta-lactamase class C family)
MPIDLARAPRLNALLAAGLEQGLYLGAVYAILHGGELVAEGAVGRQHENPDRPVTRETIFDLASLTKPVATATAILLLAEEGAFHLGEEVASFLPEGAGERLGGITLRHLLTHTSGLPAWRDFHSHGWGREEIVARVVAAEREHPIGARYVYSDLGFILLGAVVERVAGTGLAEFAAARIFGPLGMNDTGFRPGPERAERLAATRCPRRGVLLGPVHDENAAAMAGVAGHAGLFGTAGDLARYAAMLLRGGAIQDADGRSQGSSLLGALTVAAMARNALDPAIGGSSLGWFTPPNGMLPAGDFLPPDAFGHTGFTGTSLLIVPSLDLAAILLTNRVYQERDSTPFLRLRRRFHNVVASLFRL